MSLRVILYSVLVLLTLSVTEKALAQWTPLAPAPMSKYGSENLTFFDRNNGVFLASNTKLSRTTNGGDTWSNFGALPPIAKYAEMRFAARDLGYLLADGRLFNSTDQGATWSELPLAEIMPDTLKSRTLRLEVYADKSLMVRNSDVYISSKDSGRTWRIVQAFQHGAWGTGEAVFGSADNGMITDGFWYKEINELPVVKGSAFSTTDGGVRWKAMNIWEDQQPYIQFIWGHDERWLGFHGGLTNPQRMRPIVAEPGEDPKEYQELSYAPLTGSSLTAVFSVVYFNGHWIAVGRDDQTEVFVHSLDNGSSWSRFTQFEPKSDAVELMVSLDSTTLFALPNYNTVTAYRLDQVLEVQHVNWKEERLHVYPNPASSRIVIGGSSDGDVATIYDALGRSVLQGRISEQMLSITHLEAGPYIVICGGKQERFIKIP